MCQQETSVDVLSNFMDVSIFCLFLLPGYIINYVINKYYPSRRNTDFDKIFSYFFQAYSIFVI